MQVKFEQQTQEECLDNLQTIYMDRIQGNAWRPDVVFGFEPSESSTGGTSLPWRGF